MFDIPHHLAQWKYTTESAVLQQFFLLKRKVSNKSLTSYMRCVLQAFTEWSDHENWKLEFSILVIKQN